jgi:putative FmdB family regulatory protein
MPRYDFKCPNCHHHFHAWKAYGARRAGCPICGSASPRTNQEAPHGNGRWGCVEETVMPLCPQLRRWDARRGDD